MSTPFNKLRAAALRLANLFRKQKLDRELTDELESHLQLHIEDNLHAGMSPAEARREALLKLGGLEPTKENYRDHRGFPFLESVIQDLRFALRMLRKSPGFTATAVLTLALGIGVNSAIFSVLDAVLLKPLPVEKPQELHQIRIEALTRTAGRFSYLEFQHLRDSSNASGRMASMSRVVDVNLRIEGVQQPELAKMQLVSGEYFPVLGLYPALGRTLTPSDNQTIDGHPVAVISDNFWHRRFGGASTVLGQGITLNGSYFTIVGVGPRDFSGVWMESPVDVWVPLMMQSSVHYAQHYSASNSDDTKPWIPQEGIRWLDLIFRAKPGAETAAASASVNSVFQQWVAQEAETIGDLKERKLFLQRKLVLAPFERGFSDLRRDFATPLSVLMAMVALVLLVACANIANLLLARGATRQREIAIRLSTGAGRFRLIRQLVTESVLLASIGALLGLLVAYWGSAVLVRMATGVNNGSPPVAAGVDARVLLFTMGLAVVTGITFGLAPAFRMTHVELNTALKAASTGWHRGRRSSCR